MEQSNNSSVVLSQEQVDKLNNHQKNPIYHPYTCGGNRTDEHHLDGEGKLVATTTGWICPYCEYTQPYRYDS
jgi:hypothetical protein